MFKIAANLKGQEMWQLKRESVTQATTSAIKFHTNENYRTSSQQPTPHGTRAELSANKIFPTHNLAGGVTGCSDEPFGADRLLRVAPNAVTWSFQSVEVSNIHKSYH